MSFTTSQTLSITVSADDANRIAAAMAVSGFASLSDLALSLVNNYVSSYEQQAVQQAYTFTPIAFS